MSKKINNEEKEKIAKEAEESLYRTAKNQLKSRSSMGDGFLRNAAAIVSSHNTKKQKETLLKQEDLLESMKKQSDSMTKHSRVMIILTICILIFAIGVNNIISFFISLFNLFIISLFLLSF